MKVLFIGDIVGKGGRRAVRAAVPELRREHGCCFCIANGENMAGGGGMTRRCLEEMADSEVDVFTGGDHMWDQREFVEEVRDFPGVLRPANVDSSQPGRGYGVFPLPGGGSIGVMCLLGRTFMNNFAACPFREADSILAGAVPRTRNIVVDFHAEATSEKIALARHLDGRVSAVLGTHTHVPTADETVFPQGTAFQCDVGMVGGRESILGRAAEPVLKRFRTGMPARLTVVEKGIRLHGTIIELDGDGRAVGIKRVTRDFP